MYSVQTDAFSAAGYETIEQAIQSVDAGCSTPEQLRAAFAPAAADGGWVRIEDADGRCVLSIGDR